MVGSERKNMLKLGFLFGAGAEISYGLPTGGKFALDIFRHDSSSSKEEFKKMRDKVDKTTKYASKWLPDDYSTKNISSYGKTVFESIIKDTIEHNRDSIIKKLNGFDSFAAKAKFAIKQQNGKDIDNIISEALGRSASDIHMNQSVSFVEAFNDGNQLFGNNYFSALLLLYKNKNFFSSEENRGELGRILVAIMQLQIGALSENLTRKINDNILSKKDDEIDLFDDLGEIIQLNYQATGLSGIEYLLEKGKVECSTDASTVLRFAQYIIEDVYASVLDYKSLIDSNWHYLYYPKNEWAKFCKICIFLLTVRDYITKEAGNLDTKVQNGYYHELVDLCKAHIFPSAVATTNYNRFISDMLDGDIIYLNGSTELWYDPYLNRIGTREILDSASQHFLVPLLFTQSGTKPMTSIDMSIKYVDTYNKWKDSDAIVTIGFAFNSDDEHINSILRTLIEHDSKRLIAITLDNGDTNDKLQQQIADKLKVSNPEKVAVIQVDANRKCGEKLWVNCLLELFP